MPAQRDVACQWNEAQVIVILTAEEVNLDLIRKRVEDGFKREKGSSTSDLLIKFQPIKENFYLNSQPPDYTGFSFYHFIT